MRLTEKNGQFYVDQIGLDKPLIFPGTMDRQTIARAVMSRYGDQIRQTEENLRLMGGPPSEAEAAMLGAGQTGEMLWDALQRPGLEAVELMGGSITGEDRLTPMRERAEMRPVVGDFVRQYQPTAFNLGAMVPYFAPPAGMASRPIEGLLNRLGVARLPGAEKVPEYVGRSVVADTAGQGAMLGMLSDEGTAAEGAAYGVGGGVLGQALSRLLRPADRFAQDPHLAMMAEKGESLGYQLSPAQITGSRPLEMFEDAMEQNLIMGGGAIKRSEANQANSNRIVAQALGFTDKTYNKVTSDMLDQVSDRFNDRFESLTKGQSVKVDTPRFWDKVVDLEAKTVDYPLYNKDFKAVIDKTLDLIAKGDGWLSGEQYQTLSSKLTKGIRAGYKPGSGQADFADELVELKDALDEAAMNSLGDDVLQRFRDVRSDYRVYSNLMKNSVINEDTGDVSLRQLGNVLRRDDKYGYRRGKDVSDLYEATRYTRAFPGLPGESPTARRLAVPQTVAGMGLFGMLGAMQSDGSLSGTAASAAAFPASMWLMGRYYNSPMGRRHFGRGLLPPFSDEFRRYLGQGIGRASTAAAVTQ